VACCRSDAKASKAASQKDRPLGLGLNYGHYSIRLTGQDVERGTFNQRHAVLWDQNTGVWEGHRLAGHRCVGGAPPGGTQVCGRGNAWRTAGVNAFARARARARWWWWWGMCLGGGGLLLRSRGRWGLFLGLHAAPLPTHLLPPAGSRQVLLNCVAPGKQETMQVWNSPLSEAAVLG